MAAPLTTGSVYDWDYNARRDGAPWDLTTGTVTLYFRKPNGQVASVAQTPVVASSGAFTYRNPTTLLDQAGTWYRYRHIVDGAVEQWSIPRRFSVIDPATST